MSFEFKSVEIVPQQVIGGQGFLMAVQIALKEGMNLAIAQFTTEDDWVGSFGKYTLGIEFEGEVFPLGVFKEKTQGLKSLSNVDFDFEYANGDTVVEIRSFKKFNGVLGVLSNG